MKRFLAILVLGLLWSNNSFAELLDLGNEVKINIPNNFEYVQVPLKKFNEANALGLGFGASEIEEQYRERKKSFSYTGTEMTTFIGTKGFKNSYGKLLEEVLKGNQSSIDRISENLAQKCQNRTSEKFFYYCFFNQVHADPLIQVVKSNGISFDFKEFNSIFNKPLSSIEKKEIIELKKEIKHNKFQKIYNTKTYKSKGKIKLNIIDEKRWSIEIIGIEKLRGVRSKRHGYLLVINDYVFTIDAYSYCLKLKDCENYDHLLKKIVEPSFSLPTANIEEFDLMKKKDLVKLIGTAKTGYKYYRYYKMAKYLALLL